MTGAGRASNRQVVRGNAEMQERWLDVPGGRVFALEWGGADGGAGRPTLLFCHATGMCAQVYAALLAPLAAAFHVVAYDARGHGRTELPTDPAEVPADWRLYREDLAAVVAALWGGPVLLAGHSLGATVALEAAADMPGLAVAVLMIDPPFIPFPLASGYRKERDGGHLPPNPMAERAERRSARFPNRAAARAAWLGRGVFAGWPDAALDAYLASGMVDEDDSVRLACSPAWEAATFRGVTTTLEQSMEAVSVPVAILAAGVDSTVGDADAATMQAMGVAVERLPDAGHFLPVTHADAVGDWIQRTAGALAVR